ncbi:YdbH domain-containing protein [Desulfobacterales bacterium HSG2]|nr:YdbH domain-containing protein [Desulfobacterales bacterium HSG2]
MSLKRNIVYCVSSALFFIFALSFVLTCLYFYIPAYIHSKVIPSVPEKTGIRDFRCEVRRVGLTGADIASLQIGDGENTALQVSSARIDYSPQGLYGKHIRKTTFSGIELHCGIEDGEFVIRGFDLKAFLARRRTEPPSSDPSEPVSVGCIEIRDAVIVFDWEGRRFRLPLELEILPDKTWSVFDCILRLYPRGQEILFAVKPHLKEKRIRLKFNAKAIRLERFADFLKQVPELILSGEADINGEILLRTGPFEISSISASCEFRDHGSAYKNFKLRGDAPCRVEIKGSDLLGDPGNLNMSLSAISLLSPMPLTLADMRCDLKMTRDMTEGAGSFRLDLEKSDGNQAPVKITEPFQTNGNFFVSLGKEGGWEFGITVLRKSLSGPKTCGFSINPLDILANIPKIDICGKGKGDKGTIEYDVILSDMKASGESFAVNLHRASLRGKAGVGDALRTDAVVSVSDAGIASSNLRIDGIHGLIPLKWPCEKPGRKGSVSVKSVQWDAMKIGSVSGTVRQRKSGFVFNGSHQSSLIPGLILKFDGRTGSASSEEYGTEIRFASHHKITWDMDLGQFAPAAEGVTVNGELDIKGGLVSGKNGTRCVLNSTLTRANLMLKEKDIAVEGIDLAFSMPDLPETHSAPKQTFRFKNAAFGGLRLDDGDIEFQLESDGSLFIEKSSFRWCNGKVGFQALRISPGAEDYDPVLYCDRLNLAMLLEQLGTGNAEGDGTVNGRIPIRYKGGKLMFDDAFLFSTPGEGGTIHLTGAEMLTAGIPLNTLQYAQIDLALEALKDFNYKWAKVMLTTEGEDLKVGIQFDGAPAKPLPFIYKKEVGGFVRVDAGGRGSHFQGIRLDVNMGLPLDKILRYKDVLKF